MLSDLPRASGRGFNSSSVLTCAGILAFTFATNLINRVAAQSVLETVAARNQQAAGLPAGVRYDAMGAKALTASGQVLFESFLTDGQYGYWLGKPGALTPVARTGAPSPGGLGDFVSGGLGFSPGSVNASGHVAFGGATTSGNSGIWVGPPSGLTRVLAGGDPAPGASGAVFAPFTLNDNLHSPKHLTDAGQLVHHAYLTGAVVNSANNLGIWKGPPNALE
jgi:hypothetical protein